MPTLHGGCLCGQVRYQVSADRAQTVVCHCRHCQKQSGSAFSIMVVAPRASVTLSGELGSYIDRGDSGATVLRRFCPVCGSSVVSEPGSMPAVLAIKAGTLDDVSALRPQAHVWCASAQPWVALPADVPCLQAQ